MVGVVNVVAVDPAAHDDDDRRSTSTVASTVGTGAYSLASRMAALAIDWSDKLEGRLEEEGEGELGGDDGVRSERTLIFLQDDDGGSTVLEEHEGVGDDDRVAYHGRHGHGRSPGSPDPYGQRLPLQICAHLFVAKGNMQLKRLLIGQVEELCQHGYVVIDNFITRELAQQVKLATLLQHSKGRMADAPRTPAGLCAPEAAVAAAARGGPCDQVLPLVIGKPPADSSPMAALLVALQELYEDLHEFMRLRRPLGEYQATMHPAGSAGTPRHRDALPDNGRKRGRRRVTCIVSCNDGYSADDGGVVSIWPPRSGFATGSGFGTTVGLSAVGSGIGGVGTTSGSASHHERHMRDRMDHLSHMAMAAAAAASSSSAAAGGMGGHMMHTQRSFTGSDAGTSYTESDTCSLRSHYTGIGGSYLNAAGSVSSSMWAEATSVLGDGDRGSVLGRDDGTEAGAPATGAPGATGAAASAAAVGGLMLGDAGTLDGGGGGGGERLGSSVGSVGQQQQQQPSGGGGPPGGGSSSFRAGGGGYGGGYGYGGGSALSTSASSLPASAASLAAQHATAHAQALAAAHAWSAAHAVMATRPGGGGAGGGSGGASTSAAVHGGALGGGGGSGGAGGSSSSHAGALGGSGSVGDTSGGSGRGTSGSGAVPQGLEWVERDGEMVLEVSPLPGRLIVLLSGAVDHAHRAVGPGADLASVTAWYQ